LDTLDATFIRLKKAWTNGTTATTTNDAA
jgi:hypothetical protein